MAGEGPRAEGCELRAAEGQVLLPGDAPTMTRQIQRVPVLLFAAVLCVGIGVGATLGAVAWRNSMQKQGAGPSAASSQPLPLASSTTKSATAQYLAGDGALVLQFRSASAPLRALSGSTAGTQRLSVCQKVSDALQPVAPGALLTAASGIPDATLRELEVDERRIVSDALVACGKSDDAAMDISMKSLWALDTLIQRRMKELAV